MDVMAVAGLCRDVARRVAIKDTALRIRFPRRAECAGDGGPGEGMGVRAVACLCSDVACRVAINGGPGEGMGVRAVACLCSDVACRVALKDTALH